MGTLVGTGSFIKSAIDFRKSLRNVKAPDEYILRYSNNVITSEELALSESLEGVQEDPRYTIVKAEPSS